MNNCIACNNKTVVTVLDLGLQPPSNRFHQDPDNSEVHALKLGSCDDCGHIQLIQPMPVKMVTPLVDWIFYNEPEGHLDSVVQHFVQLQGINKNSLIRGVTYKEDTTIERLNKIGYTNTTRLDTVKDLHLHDNAGLEQIQETITPETMNGLKQEKADMVFARHILEHAHNPRQFLEAIKEMVMPAGYIVFEVPDSSKFIASYDYPFIWEEHISYFTEETLKDFLEKNGFVDIEIQRYSYTFEDSLVAIAKQGNGKATVKKKDNKSNNVVDDFGKNFSILKERIQQILKFHHEKGECIAVFGAGHLAAKFINFFDISEHIVFVLDDHPQKQNLMMPGNSVPIVSSDRLKEVDLCLLSLSPESETKIKEKFHWYEDGNRKFKSIFTGSDISIFRDEI